MTKLEVMERHWNRYGVASSFNQMAGELRHYWPQKNDSYSQECKEFIENKKRELSRRKDSRQDMLDNMKGMLMKRLESIFYNNKTYYEVQGVGVPIPSVIYSNYNK